MLRKQLKRSVRKGALVKVVVDTNIWISSLIASSKTAVGLIDAWEKETFQLLVSEQQLVELAEVILRPKFSLMYRFSPQEIKDIIDSISARAERITLKGNLNICRDPDDNVIIETAVKGKAKYLVTGDKDITDDKAVSSYLTQYRDQMWSFTDCTSFCFLNSLSSRTKVAAFDAHFTAAGFTVMTQI